MSQPRLSQALIAETIGTFALVFIGAGAGALGLGGLPGVALAHGLVIVALAYAYGHFSGTHVNPAVTFGLLVAGKIDAKRALSYWFFQCVGAIAAGYALLALFGGPVGKLGAGALAQSLNAGGQVITITPLWGFLLEALLAFFLLNTIFNCAVSGKAGNFAGLAIGVTLIFNILMGGPLTGAIFNPARQLGPALAAGQFDNLLLYLTAPLVGAAAAALLYKGAFEK